MASNTMATWHKRVRSKVNMGRKRKNADARHSTPSSAELFGALGEPGKAAPAVAPSIAKPKAAVSKSAKPSKSASKAAAKTAPATK